MMCRVALQTGLVYDTTRARKHANTREEQHKNVKELEKLQQQLEQAIQDKDAEHHALQTQLRLANDDKLQLVHCVDKLRSCLFLSVAWACSTSCT